MGEDSKETLQQQVQQLETWAKAKENQIHGLYQEIETHVQHKTWLMIGVAALAVLCLFLLIHQA